MILVVDVSGSMQATDVKPTRLGAAQDAVRTFLDHVPKRVRVGLIAFAGEPTWRRRRRPTATSCAARSTRSAAPRASAAPRSATRSPRRSSSAAGRRATKPASGRRSPSTTAEHERRSSRSSSSPTARRTAACCSRSRAPRGRRPPASRSTRSRSARRTARSPLPAAAVRAPAAAGFGAAAASRAARSGDAARDRDVTGGKFFNARSAKTAQRRVREARLAARPQAGQDRDHERVRALGRRCCCSGAGALRALVAARALRESPGPPRGRTGARTAKVSAARASRC